MCGSLPFGICRLIGHPGNHREVGNGHERPALCPPRFGLDERLDARLSKPFSRTEHPDPKPPSLEPRSLAFRRGVDLDETCPAAIGKPDGSDRVSRRRLRIRRRTPPEVRMIGENAWRGPLSTAAFLNEEAREWAIGKLASVWSRRIFWRRVRERAVCCWLDRASR